MRVAAVCTTVFDPDFLPPLCTNLRAHGHDHETTIWIIPDRKTPPSAARKAEHWQMQGFDVRYLTLPHQEEFLRSLGPINDLIPYDSDNRRNVGFLKALEQGADVLISIDDDNYPRTEYDFVGEHNIIGQHSERLIYSPNRWFNTCELLAVEPRSTVYPRGFPYRVRQPEPLTCLSSNEHLPIGINVGLWLDDPDVDAISRNFAHFRVTGWSRRDCCLAPGTWTPINTQNTALLGELIPAYYYVPMNEPIEGLRIDRYGDILSGLFCKKVCDHLGYAVRVGGPICDHRRTPHNLLKDLHQELAGIALLEELTAWLEEVRLAGSTASEAYLHLADALDEALPSFHGYLWGEDARAFFHKVTGAMRVWIETTRTIAHERTAAAAAR
jgi:hypothetical protein